MTKPKTAGAPTPIGKLLMPGERPYAGADGADMRDSVKAWLDAQPGADVAGTVRLAEGLCIEGPSAREWPYPVVGSDIWLLAVVRQRFFGDKRDTLNRVIDESPAVQALLDWLRRPHPSVEDALAFCEFIGPHRDFPRAPNEPFGHYLERVVRLIPMPADKQAGILTLANSLKRTIAHDPPIDRVRRDLADAGLPDTEEVVLNVILRALGAWHDVSALLDDPDALRNFVALIRPTWRGGLVTTYCLQEHLNPEDVADVHRHTVHTIECDGRDLEVKALAKAASVARDHATWWSKRPNLRGRGHKRDDIFDDIQQGIPLKEAQEREWKRVKGTFKKADLAWQKILSDSKVRNRYP